MTKLQDSIQEVEELKKKTQIFWECPEDDLFQLYGEYQIYKEKLEHLLSTMARYRIQLNLGENTIFGPKTRETIRLLVSNYDKIYEIDEQYLSHRFLWVEQQKCIEAELGINQCESEEISLEAETRKDLERINLAKRLLDEEGKKDKTIDISNFRKEVKTVDILHEVQSVYSTEAADNLEKVLREIYRSHPEAFQEIIKNVGKLIYEITRRPDEIRFRLLRINNAELQQDFLKYPRSAALLKFLKFDIRHSDQMADLLSTLSIPDVSDEYFLYLHEPDMFSEYPKWKAWLDFIVEANSTLNKFISHYKSLIKTGKFGEDAICDSLSAVSSSLDER